MQSDEDILDILSSCYRDKPQMVIPIDPEDKVIIVVDVNSSSGLKALSPSATVSSQREDFSLEKFLQLSPV